MKDVKNIEAAIASCLYSRLSHQLKGLFFLIGADLRPMVLLLSVGCCLCSEDGVAGGWEGNREETYGSCGQVAFGGFFISHSATVDAHKRLSRYGVNSSCSTSRKNKQQPRCPLHSSTMPSIFS